MSQGANGKFVVVETRNPVSVCDAHALLACALLSVGVREHPDFAFAISEEEVAGSPVTIWRWLFCAKSADGLYETAKLVEWWSDAQWLAEHPAHEWTILRHGLMNMAEVALRIRETVPRLVVRRGAIAAYIPANATPERKQKLLDALDGRITPDEVFAKAS